MQKFNSIYKIVVNSDKTSIVLDCVANISNDSSEKSVLYIANTNELDKILINYTPFFHYNYFRLNNKPLIIFETKKLENSFNNKTKDLNLGGFYTINKQGIDNNIFINPEPNHFSEWRSDVNLNRYFYFISENGDEFNIWKKGISQEEINNLIQSIELLNKLTTVKKSENKLTIENQLLQESLVAIKTEYSKELDWYKKEIMKIKDWYKKEHKNTPKIITKVFKKLSLQK